MKLKKFLKSELPFSFSVPVVVWQLFFFFIPLLLIAAFSLVQKTPFAAQAKFSLIHYRELFDFLYVKIIFRSLALATVTTMICLLCGYPIAYYLGIKRRDRSVFYIFFLILPFWTNFLVHAYAWFFVLEKEGVLNSLLMNIGLITEPLHLLNTFFAVMVVMVYCYMPFMILPLFTTLEKFDLTLVEASKDLGATQRQTFFNVILPQSLPGIKTGIFLVFVPAFAEFVIPMLLGGDKNMYVGSLISHYFVISQNFSSGSAFTIVAIGIVMAALGILHWLLNRLYTSTETKI